MRAVEVVQKTRVLVSRLGVTGASVYAARRALANVPGRESFRMSLIVLTTARPTVAAEEAAKHHVFRFVTREELVEYIKVPEAKLHDRDLASFDIGNRCLLQLDGTKLVGYTWIGTSRLIELMWGMHFNMPDDMVYNYNGLTVPAYRGMSFQALRHLKILELCRLEGTRRLFGFVDHLNISSLRGVEKSGYVQVGTLSGVRRFGEIKFSLQVNDDAWSTHVRVGPVQH
jgi:hypothetical protein